MGVVFLSTGERENEHDREMYVVGLHVSVLFSSVQDWTAYIGIHDSGGTRHVRRASFLQVWGLLLPIRSSPA